jgi:membrane protease YdiL (CAAX protease family)
LNDDPALTPSEAIPPASVPPAPATPAQSTLHNIFVGKDGLRAGWSLLIFAAIFAALAFCVNVIGHKLWPSSGKALKASSEVSPRFLYIAESIPLLITVIATWIMSKIERRRNSVYGLGGSRKFVNFLTGLGWGVLCISLLVLTLSKSGLLVIDRRLLFGGDTLRYGTIWLFGFLLVGLLEEYLTRGYVQYTLTRGLAGIYAWAFKTRHSQVLGFWTAAVIFSVLFGLGHGKNVGESPIGLLSAGLAAMIFCLSLWRTGSLWWAVGFHTTWDWGQSFLYGVADSGMMAQHHLLATHPVGAPILSGGTTGPEGSIYVIAILAFASCVIVFTVPRGQYGDARSAPQLQG